MIPQKRALILKLGQIGDIIMAIPAAYALHQQGFEINWVCGRAAWPLVESYSWIRCIAADDKAILRGNFPQRVKGILACWWKIAFSHYDLCATLYYDRRFRILSFPVRASRKVTLSKEDRSRTLLAGRHHTEEYVRVLLEQQDTCREFSTSPVPPDRLPPSPLPEKIAPMRIAIGPGGTSNVLGQQVLRRWPMESYVILAQRLLSRGWEVLLLGGPEDEWVKPFFRSLDVKDCIGKHSLPEVVSLCGACDAVITHDTGPLHLAGLSKTCLVGIFGPTDPATRVPRRPFAVGIWGGQGFACRPCYDGRDFAPCHFNGCMHQVGPDLVLRELDRLLHARFLGESIPWQVVFPDLSAPIVKPVVAISPDERAR